MSAPPATTPSAASAKAAAFWNGAARAPADEGLVVGVLPAGLVVPAPALVPEPAPVPDVCEAAGEVEETEPEPEPLPPAWKVSAFAERTSTAQREG
jgi:hypothetical protein